MKIAIGCDPNAQEAKEELIRFIKEKNYGEVTDFGSTDPIYANTAIKVAEAIASKKYDRGILKGVYAALLSDVYSAQRARLSNDANVACMGAFTSGSKNREMMTEAFLSNEFVPGCSSQPKVEAFVRYDSKR